MITQPTLVSHCFKKDICVSFDVNTADIRVPAATGTLFTGQFARSISVIIRANTDQVTQEGVEVFEILLHITSEDLSEPVFIMGSAFVTVNDTTGELHYTIGCI